jgi:hypothetical protein
MWPFSHAKMDAELGRLREVREKVDIRRQDAVRNLGRALEPAKSPSLDERLDEIINALGARRK